MTKHKIGMVTRNTPHPIIVVLSDEVVKISFLLICMDRYQFSVVSGNRSIDTYLPRGSKENVLSTTITKNVTMSR